MKNYFLWNSVSMRLFYCTCWNNILKRLLFFYKEIEVQVFPKLTSIKFFVCLLHLQLHFIANFLLRAFFGEFAVHYNE